MVYLKHPAIIAGYLLNLIIFALFLLAKNSTPPSDFLDFGENIHFTLAHFLNFFYLVFLGVRRIAKGEKRSAQPRSSILLLWLSACYITAYILNFSFPVFPKLEPYAAALAVAVVLNLLTVAVWPVLPGFVQRILPFLTGFIILFVLAQTLHTLPIYGYAAIGLALLGISWYAFIPLILLLLLGSHLFSLYKTRQSRWTYALGLVIPLIVCAWLMVSWNSYHGITHQVHAEKTFDTNEDMPNWVLFSQKIDDSWLGKRIVLGEDFYTQINSDPFRSFNTETQRYDPLVSLGLLIYDDLPLSKKDREKILQSQFDGRHSTYQKLWSDRDLTTYDVLTETVVYPAYATAYMEKTIRIENEIKKNSWRGNTQEALYTFYLPEGAVATSLSLWVNGVEEKSRLTTKSKASKAYNQIVGRESRDPALLHWQEGNRITVTVFPCTPSEMRQVKVGFTIPLVEKDGDFTLSNIYFDGPNFSNSYETNVIRVDYESELDMDLPNGFELNGPKSYRYTGDYTADWDLVLKAPKLSKETFKIDGFAYSILPAETEKSVKFEAVYLDVNAEWKASEIEHILSFTKLPTYTHYNGWIELNETNYESVHSKLAQNRFSLFPYYAIPTDAKGLVISKSIANSPNFSDLKASSYYKEMRSWAAMSANPMPVVLLSEDISPIEQTLRQFNEISVTRSSMDQLSSILETEKIGIAQSDSNRQLIGGSGMNILRQPNEDSTANVAPDHLVRLFMYNQLLHRIGGDFFTEGSYVKDELIELADYGHVASPLSSLIVLETQKDYERFDIQKSKKGLKNATTKSSGSVPEPHEWLLIGLAVFIGIWQLFKARGLC